MIGTFYGIGVGPGDPELMTLAAVRVIRMCEVIAIPMSGEGEAVALQIARGAVPEVDSKDLLELSMPMTRDQEQLTRSHDEAARLVAERLRQGQSVAFLTLGDPSVYSTFAYVHKRILAMGLPAQMVAGVPSFCAVAARLNEPLVEGAQALHVLPASYAGAEGGLDLPGTKVLMKTGRSVGTVKQQLRSRRLYHAARMVQKCGMDGEQIYHNLDDVDDGSSYFSIIVVKDQPAGV